MRFKYRVVNMQDKDLQKELSRLGSEGWKLSHICQNTKYIFIKGHYL